MPVSQHDLAGAEAVPRGAEERVLSRLLSLVRADGQVAHRTGGQADDGDDPGDREAHAGGLRLGLGEDMLIRLSVGHRDRGAVDQDHLTTLPEPLAGGTLPEADGDAPDQASEHADGEPLPRLAVTPGLRRARVLPPRGAVSDQPRHGQTAGVIGAEDLREEGPEGDDRAVCAVIRRGSSVGEIPTRQLVVPAGSNRSGGGGNEAAGAFDGKGQRVAPRAGRP